MYGEKFYSTTRCSGKHLEIRKAVMNLPENTRPSISCISLSLSQTSFSPTNLLFPHTSLASLRLPTHTNLPTHSTFCLTDITLSHELLIILITRTLLSEHYPRSRTSFSSLADYFLNITLSHELDSHHLHSLRTHHYSTITSRFPYTYIYTYVYIYIYIYMYLYIYV